MEFQLQLAAGAAHEAASHGLYFPLAYTYAHALDDASGYESSSGAKGVTTNFVPGYEYLNYGDSDYDFRQRLVATYNCRFRSALCSTTALLTKPLRAGTSPASRPSGRVPHHLL